MPFLNNRKSFRPAYGKLDLLTSIFSKTPIIGLTATATKQMQQKIVEAMGMISSFVIDVHVNPDRKNIYFSSSRRGNQGDEKLVNILDPLLKDPKATMADQAKVDLFHGALNFGLQFLGLGHLQLKEKQYEVLKHVVLNNRDVLAVLPTGYGKSLTYQMLPPVLNFVDFGAEEKKATVIVISPLNALIRDQIVKMRESGLSVCVLRGDRVDTEDGGKNIYFSSSRRGNQGDEKLVNILDPLLKDVRSRRQDFPLTIIYGTWRPWRIVFLTLVVNLEMNNMNQ